MIIPEAIKRFFQEQGYVIMASIDSRGFPHLSCKGIVKIEQPATVYLLDVYHGLTSRNIRANPQASISAVDEHKFVGYCLKGSARLLPDDRLSQEIIRSWEEKITSRIAKRLLRNLREEKAGPHHPEASLPGPKSLICFEVSEIVDLGPRNLK